MNDLELLVRDKYNGDASLVTEEDRTRLVSGEPLAYVIGWVPFLGKKILLTLEGSPVRALIPRPETEWWTESLIEHLQAKILADSLDPSFSLLDLCAGSGAIGIALAAAFPKASVTFSELDPDLAKLIQKNLIANSLYAEVITGDLFEKLAGRKFDVIATNPPYIPANRADELEDSVTKFEPHLALFSGEDGLECISRILNEAPYHLTDSGELWMECDISNIEKAKEIALGKNFKTTILEDQFGRPRVLILSIQP